MTMLVLVPAPVLAVVVSDVSAGAPVGREGVAVEGGRAGPIPQHSRSRRRQAPTAADDGKGDAPLERSARLRALVPRSRLVADRSSRPLDEDLERTRVATDLDRTRGYECDCMIRGRA